LASDFDADFVPGYSGGPVPELHGVPCSALVSTWIIYNGKSLMLFLLKVKSKKPQAEQEFAATKKGADH